MNCISVADFLSTYTYIYVIRMPSRVGSETLRNSSEHSALIYLPENRTQIGISHLELFEFHSLAKILQYNYQVSLSYFNNRISDQLYICTKLSKQIGRKVLFFHRDKNIILHDRKRNAMPFQSKRVLAFISESKVYIQPDLSIQALLRLFTYFHNTV